MKDHAGGEIYIPDHSDPGTEQTDPQNVSGVRKPGKTAQACTYHEYNTG